MATTTTTTTASHTNAQRRGPASSSTGNSFELDYDPTLGTDPAMEEALGLLPHLVGANETYHFESFHDDDDAAAADANGPYATSMPHSATVSVDDEDALLDAMLAQAEKLAAKMRRAASTSSQEASGDGDDKGDPILMQHYTNNTNASSLSACNMGGIPATIEMSHDQGNNDEDDCTSTTTGSFGGHIETLLDDLSEGKLWNENPNYLYNNNNGNNNTFMSSIIALHGSMVQVQKELERELQETYPDEHPNDSSGKGYEAMLQDRSSENHKNAGVAPKVVMADEKKSADGHEEPDFEQQRRQQGFPPSFPPHPSAKSNPSTSYDDLLFVGGGDSPANLYKSAAAHQLPLESPIKPIKPLPTAEPVVAATGGRRSNFEKTANVLGMKHPEHPQPAAVATATAATTTSGGFAAQSVAAASATGRPRVVAKSLLTSDRFPAALSSCSSSKASSLDAASGYSTSSYGYGYTTEEQSTLEGEDEEEDQSELFLNDDEPMDLPLSSATAMSSPPSLMMGKSIMTTSVTGASRMAQVSFLSDPSMDQDHFAKVMEQFNPFDDDESQQQHQHNINRTADYDMSYLGSQADVDAAIQAAQHMALALQALHGHDDRAMAAAGLAKGDEDLISSASSLLPKPLPPQLGVAVTIEQLSTTSDDAKDPTQALTSPLPALFPATPNTPDIAAMTEPAVNQKIADFERQAILSTPGDDAKWEKMSYTKEVDDDYVPLSDYSKFGACTNQQQVTVASNSRSVSVVATTAAAAVTSQSFHSEAASVTSDSIRWEKASFADHQDDDFVPISDYAADSKSSSTTNTTSSTFATSNSSSVTGISYTEKRALLRRQRIRKQRRLLRIAAIVAVLLLTSSILWYTRQNRQLKQNEHASADHHYEQKHVVVVETQHPQSHMIYHHARDAHDLSTISFADGGAGGIADPRSISSTPSPLMTSLHHLAQAVVHPHVHHDYEQMHVVEQHYYDPADHHHVVEHEMEENEVPQDDQGEENLMLSPSSLIGMDEAFEDETTVSKGGVTLSTAATDTRSSMSTTTMARPPTDVCHSLPLAMWLLPHCHSMRSHWTAAITATVHDEQQHRVIVPRAQLEHLLEIMMQ